MSFVCGDGDTCCKIWRYSVWTGSDVRLLPQHESVDMMEGKSVNQLPCTRFGVR